MFINFNFCLKLGQVLQILYGVFVVNLLVLKYPVNITIPLTYTKKLNIKPAPVVMEIFILQLILNCFNSDLCWTPQQTQYNVTKNPAQHGTTVSHVLSAASVYM